MPLVVNGYNLDQRWPAAEKHFRKMASKYVTPAIAYAQQMAARPWYPPLKIAAILNVIRELEKVKKLYTGPIHRHMEEVLAAADGYFRTVIRRLDELDS